MERTKVIFEVVSSRKVSIIHIIFRQNGFQDNRARPVIRAGKCEGIAVVFEVLHLLSTHHDGSSEGDARRCVVVGR